MQEKHLSFHSLDALRFIAFFKVFLLHVAQFEPDPLLHRSIFDGGEMGVDFFFVLSGFLITYLLTFEKINNGHIDGRKYFLRRSLRIWPLFYLGIAIAYANNFLSAALGQGTSDGYPPNIFFSVAFLENYQMIFHGIHPNGAPLRVFWSLCVEEHFYLIWFLIFRFIPLKKMARVFVILWLTGIAYRIWFHHQFPDFRYYDVDVVSRMDFFCAGGLVGLMAGTDLGKMKGLADRIKPVWRNMASVLIVLFFFFHQLIFAGRVSEIYVPIISSTLFAALLWLIATSSTFIRFGKDHLLSRLGRISYGLYVYHTVVIVVLTVLLHRAGITIGGPTMGYVFSLACLLASIGVSMLSFRYFEKPFLDLKRKYTDFS